MSKQQDQTACAINGFYTLTEMNGQMDAGTKLMVTYFDFNFTYILHPFSVCSNGVRVLPSLYRRQHWVLSIPQPRTPIPICTEQPNNIKVADKQLSLSMNCKLGQVVAAACRTTYDHDHDQQHRATLIHLNFPYMRTSICQRLCMRVYLSVNCDVYLAN